MCDSRYRGCSLWNTTNIGTRKVEVLNSLRMKTTAEENDVNNIFADVSVTPAASGVTETSAKCRFLRFLWPVFSL